MSAHNPYGWMVDLAIQHFKALQTEAKKPNLTLITKNRMTTENERNQQMSAPETQQNEGICRMPNGQPLSGHLAFVDIEEHLRILSMGSNALKGIGAMMLPGTDAADEETTTKRSELSEIFSFFGEVMAKHSGHISDAVFRIEQAANGQHG